MAPDELINALHRRPFVPFRVTLTVGSTYDVRHPELCMVGRRSAVIGLITTDTPDHLFERSMTIDLLHIVKLEPLETAATPPANGAG
jgi:hypothetical protein